MLSNLISIHGIAVLRPGFLIMTGLAKRLQILYIPKQRLVTPVWFYMIHHRCFHISAFLLAGSTKRMCFQIILTEPLPPAPVSTFPG